MVDSEKIRQQKKDWAIRNRDKYLAIKRESERKRRLRLGHKLRVRATSNIHWRVRYKDREDFKLKEKQYKKEYRQRPEQKEMNKIRLYAYTHFKPLLIEKYGGCQLCGDNNKLEIHHLRYTNNYEDVMLLCAKHHKEIHNKMKGGIKHI